MKIDLKSISLSSLSNFDHLFGFFNVPNKPVIGVDITSNSVRMVELSRKRNGNLVLESYSVVNSGRENFNEKQEISEENLVASLQKAIKHLGSNIKNISIAIPNHVTVVKTAKMPFDLDEDGLAEEVSSEAANQINFPIEEINLDWNILGPSTTSENENDVLICASRSELITNYMASAEKSGLKVSIVDIESFAKHHAYLYMTNEDDKLKEESVVFIDIGSASMSYTVYDQGKMIYNKDIPYGTNQLTDLISAVYEISHEKADEYRRAYGKELVDFQHKALNPYLETLANEINRANQFFLTQATVDKIDRIFISGFPATFSNSSSIISNVTKIPAESVNPFKYVEISNKAKKKHIDRDAPVLFTAFGLALRRFD